MSENSSDLLTVEDVAAYFPKFTRGALYVQRHRGEKPGALAVRIGKRLYWRRRDLEQFVEEAMVAQDVAL